jgi:hypothetical protein
MCTHERTLASAPAHEPPREYPKCLRAHVLLVPVTLCDRRRWHSCDTHSVAARTHVSSVGAHRRGAPDLRHRRVVCKHAAAHKLAPRESEIVAAAIANIATTTIWTKTESAAIRSDGRSSPFCAMRRAICRSLSVALVARRHARTPHSGRSLTCASVSSLMVHRCHCSAPRISHNSFYRYNLKECGCVLDVG